ncbi:hypothetical protein ALC60_12168, partial [Trachymyrmex zeteki]
SPFSEHQPCKLLKRHLKLHSLQVWTYLITFSRFNKLPLLWGFHGSHRFDEP